MARTNSWPRIPEIEAVAVSAGFAVQGDIARDLLLAGKHVFMEKPMAVSVEAGSRDRPSGSPQRQDSDGWIHEAL